MLVSAVHSAVRCLTAEENEFMVSFSTTHTPRATEAIDCQIKFSNNLKSNIDFHFDFMDGVCILLGQISHLK